MDVSIIICTYNRCESLGRTLESLCACAVSSGLRWELLVVDNNSKDRTREVCAGFKGRLPLRYMVEPRQGKSYALNRAVEEASGTLLLFTDDDVVVTPDWIVNCVKAAELHPNAMFFGGRIYPKWEKEPPKWLVDNSKSLLTGVTMHYDRGESEQIITDDRRPFWGANLAFQAKVFQIGLRFQTDIGPKGEERVCGEDTVMIRQVLARGWHGLYHPSIVVHHCNPASRMTERYLRTWHVNQGRLEAREGHIPKKHLFFGAPLYFWKELFENSIGYFLTRWFARSSTWVKLEARAAFAWGVICEARRLSQAI